ncbi:TRAP transporter substrate-binding protein DctP [uncultured Roseibium sp.]|uniref:TRAP transporter substrate-binding protein DctP n=1 Tax=uncultured Roseibium sp. TaxID=1936171 RepID=UPI003217556F
MKRLILPLLAAACALATPAMAQEKVEWRYVSVVPAGHGYAARMIEAFKGVEERTDSNFKIRFVTYGETPFKVNDALTITRDGLIDMAEWLRNYNASTYPLLAGPELPLLPEKLTTPAELQAQKVEAWSKPTISAYLGKIFDDYNAQPLITWFYDPYQLWVSSEVDSVDALKGMKIRGSTPEQAELLTGIGASPINIQPAELYTALQRGTVDGTITGQGAVTGFKWSEVLKTGFLANVMMSSSGPIVNKDRFAELPDDYKTVLMDELNKAQADLRDFMPKFTQAQQDGLREQGLNLIEPSPEMYQQLRNAAVTVTYPAWAERAGPEGRKMLEELGVQLGGD